jgi:hypothetical protein
MDEPDAPVRDAYGFPIAPAYRSLHATFAAVWTEEEAERCQRWDQWMADLQASLGYASFKC